MYRLRLLVASILVLAVSLVLVLVSAFAIIKALGLFGIEIPDPWGSRAIVSVFASTWIAGVTCIWTTKDINPRAWFSGWRVGILTGIVSSLLYNDNPAPAAFAAFGATMLFLRKKTPLENENKPERPTSSRALGDVKK